MQRMHGQAASCAMLASVVSLAVLVLHIATQRQTALVSVSPFSAKWSQGSSADSSFLESLKPTMDDEMDTDFKRKLATARSSHERKTSFSHGPTSISLGPEAIRTIADGSSISWKSPPPPEVQAAQDAAGSIAIGFGGGETMRPRMRVSPRVKKMVMDNKASVSYHDGESPERWTDPKSGTSFSLGQHDVQRGAYMRWKQRALPPVAGSVQTPKQLMRGKMHELNKGFGGAGSGGRYHMIIGRGVRDLVARHKASVDWRDGESPENPALGTRFAGRPAVSLGPHDLKRGAYIRSAEPLKALEKKMDRISSGYGGVGGRAHMVVGRHIKHLVRRNKASVDWRDGESKSHPGLEHKFVGRPAVRLGPKDFLVGAYIRPVRPPPDAVDGEGSRPTVTLSKRDTRRGSHAEWRDVPSREDEEEDKYSVVMPKFVGVQFNNHTVVGPRNLLSKERIAYHNNYTLRAHSPYTDEVDRCRPSSRCAMIKNLNRIHLAGVEHYGGKTWSPASEGAKNANWAKFDERDTDISLCQHCVTRFLADAGPARWIVGRSIAAQARQGTCAAFCVKHPTQNIPVSK